MNTWSLALKALQRDWRSGEVRLLGLALIIAVASVTAVTFFTERVKIAIEIQSSTLLAADLAVESGNPLPEQLTQTAHELHLATAQTLSFRSVVALGERLQLTEVKAVDSAYPLRGRLKIADRPFASPRDTRETPSPGTVWAESHLLQVLHLHVGDTLSLGRARLAIAKVLAFEPDRGGDMFNIAPRVLMNLEDIPATGLVLPGSRVKYRLLLAGEWEAIHAFQEWAEGRLLPNQNLMTVKEGRREIQDAIERAEQFLGLAALTSVLLAGVAIATAARRYTARHLDHAAILRCFGADQGLILRIFALEMLVFGAVMSLVGCLIGYIAQQGLAGPLSGLTVGRLPPPSLWPLVIGLLVGLITLLGFALPPLLTLKDVPPARVLRRDLGPAPPSALLVYTTALMAVALLVPWQTGQLRLTFYVLGGSLVTVLLLAAGAWSLVKGLGRLRSRVGVAWRYGLANLARRAQGSIVETVALGLGIMAMLVLSLVRADLVAEWKDKLPPEAPNHFLINIQPAEVEAMKGFFMERGFKDPAFFPMVRGRLTAINDKPVRLDEYSDPRARQLAEREFNLSWAIEPQVGNQIVEGWWWAPDTADKHQFSVETDIAETLDIHLGDTLTYQVIDQTIAAKVTNLREVDWDSFNVNFFVVAPPGLLGSYPATYVTGFYLQNEQKALLAELVRRFPSVTVVDVAALMDHVRGIMDRVAVAAEYMFFFTIAAGVLVLVAGLQATHDERRQDSAVLRTLGASHRKVVKGLMAEFLALGLVAGCLAALAAMGVGYILAEYAFHIDFRFNPWLLPVGFLTGGLGVSLVGLLSTRSVLSTPPIHTLRRI
jgi:putative ABC transport system permease protein